MKFDNMPDNMKSTEVFFRLERCANIFSSLSSIIPKQLLAVVQSIHGELCESLVLVSRAGNEPMPKKLEYLTLAERKLFYLFNRIQYLVEARAISIGQANEFSAELKEAYTQTRKWLNATRRDMANSS